MNKMRGGAEKSFLTIATLTSCLTSNPVSAQELWSPISHSLKFNNDPIATKYAALDIESAATPIGSETPVSIDSKPRSKPDLLTSIVEDGAAELGFHNCNVVSQTRQTPNSSQGKSCGQETARTGISHSLNIIHNPDLGNLFNSPNLPSSVEVAKNLIDRPAPSQQESQPNLANPRGFTNPPATTKIAQSDSGVPVNPPPPTTAQSSQNVEELMQQIRNSLLVQGTQGRSVTPAISVTTPIGFGGFLGYVGIGVAYQSRTASGGGEDGNLGATVSLGNPSKFVGLDLTLNVNSLSDNRGSRGTLGNDALSLQISRLLSDDWSVGLGAENLVRFSERNLSNIDSYYLVTTKVFSLNDDTTKPFSVLYTSIGLGTGNFVSVADLSRKGRSGVSIFGSAAVQIIEGINGIVGWSGQDLDLGVSFAPFRNIPLVITPAVVDVIGNSDNSGARFTVSAGYSFKF